MKKTIRLTESELHKIITDSVEAVLKEATPEFYSNAADKAEKQITGLTGRFNKTFRPNTYKKRTQQARDFRDMATDHPGDEWEMTWCYANRYGDFENAKFKNKRTGEERPWVPYDNNYDKNPLPFRGKLTGNAADINHNGRYWQYRDYTDYLSHGNKK